MERSFQSALGHTSFPWYPSGIDIDLWFVHSFFGSYRQCHIHKPRIQKKNRLGPSNQAEYKNKRACENGLLTQILRECQGCGGKMKGNVWNTIRGAWFYVKNTPSKLRASFHLFHQTLNALKVLVYSGGGGNSWRKKKRLNETFSELLKYYTGIHSCSPDSDHILLP